MIMIMLAVWRLKKRKSILCEINWSRQLRQAEWRHGRVLIGSHKDSWHNALFQRRIHSERHKRSLGGEQKEGRKDDFFRLWNVLEVFFFSFTNQNHENLTQPLQVDSYSFLFLFLFLFLFSFFFFLFFFSFPSFFFHFLFPSLLLVTTQR